MTLPTRDSPNVRPLHPTGGELPVERPDPLAAAWTADRLMAATFPEPRWAVPGILLEGVSLLAGPPKVGKSWLSLGLGVGIAAGWTVLGEITVQAGPVLYLALEDTLRRLSRSSEREPRRMPSPKGTSGGGRGQGGGEPAAGGVPRGQMFSRGRLAYDGVTHDLATARWTAIVGCGRPPVMSRSEAKPARRVVGPAGSPHMHVVAELGELASSVLGKPSTGACG
jgi:hypothetical protein